MLRYSYRNFFGIGETSPRFFMWNTANTTTPNDGNFKALSLIYELADQAANSGRRYAADRKIVNDDALDARYGLVQCSRDISREACTECFKTITDDISTCCDGKRGWRIAAPSCNLRYEDYLFFNLTVPAPPAMPPPAVTAPPAMTPSPVSGNQGEFSLKYEY